MRIGIQDVFLSTRLHYIQHVQSEYDGWRACQIPDTDNDHQSKSIHPGHVHFTKLLQRTINNSLCVHFYKKTV